MNLRCGGNFLCFHQFYDVDVPFASLPRDHEGLRRMVFAHCLDVFKIFRCRVEDQMGSFVYRIALNKQQFEQFDNEHLFPKILDKLSLVF